MNGEEAGGRARDIPSPAVVGDPAIEGGPHDHGEQGVDEKQDGEGESHTLQPTIAPAGGCAVCEENRRYALHLVRALAPSNPAWQRSACRR